jgi:hypothetical protein
MKPRISRLPALGLRAARVGGVAGLVVNRFARDLRTGSICESEHRLSIPAREHGTRLGPRDRQTHQQHLRLQQDTRVPCISIAS